MKLFFFKCCETGRLYFWIYIVLSFFSCIFWFFSIFFVHTWKISKYFSWFHLFLFNIKKALLVHFIYRRDKNNGLFVHFSCLKKIEWTRKKNVCHEKNKVRRNFFEIQFRPIVLHLKKKFLIWVKRRNMKLYFILIISCLLGMWLSCSVEWSFCVIFDICWHVKEKKKKTFNNFMKQSWHITDGAIICQANEKLWTILWAKKVKNQNFFGFFHNFWGFCGNKDVQQLFFGVFFYIYAAGGKFLVHFVDHFRISLWTF